jgi:ribosomal protein S12 methylthiotransferase accessory factor
MEGTTMEMKISFPGNLRVDAAYKGFTIESDQPITAGGDGSAPAPFDLFMVSLGTCAGIFMLAFMKQRHIPTEGSGITMTTAVDPEHGMVGTVGFELHLPPEFPAKYERAVIRAVEQCSVKRHLHQPPDFTVTTSRAASA